MKIRYKVGISVQAIEFYTIWAESEEEAVKQVFEDGQGRSAGVLGPTPTGAWCGEAGSDRDPQTHMSLDGKSGQIVSTLKEEEDGG